ncbi:hypothetical protein RFI_10916, partial [Reticulomyxa filosa]
TQVIMEKMEVEYKDKSNEESVIRKEFLLDGSESSTDLRLFKFVPNVDPEEKKKEGEEVENATFVFSSPFGGKKKKKKKRGLRWGKNQKKKNGNQKMYVPVALVWDDQYLVRFRPGLAEFLWAASRSYRVVLWTAAMREVYSRMLDAIHDTLVGEVMKLIETSEQKWEEDVKLWDQVYFRDNCSWARDMTLWKDVESLPEYALCQMSCRNVVIVDNVPRNFRNFENNVLPIPDFVGQKQDCHLPLYGSILKQIELKYYCHRRCSLVPPPTAAPQQMEDEQLDELQLQQSASDHNKDSEDDIITTATATTATTATTTTGTDTATIVKGADVRRILQDVVSHHDIIRRRIEEMKFDLVHTLPLCSTLDQTHKQVDIDMVTLVGDELDTHDDHTCADLSSLLRGIVIDSNFRHHSLATGSQDTDTNPTTEVLFFLKKKGGGETQLQKIWNDWEMAREDNDIPHQRILPLVQSCGNDNETEDNDGNDRLKPHQMSGVDDDELHPEEMRIKAKGYCGKTNEVNNASENHHHHHHHHHHHGEN